MRLQEVNGLPVAPAKASGATEGFIRRQTVGPGWVDLPLFLQGFCPGRYRVFWFDLFRVFEKLHLVGVQDRSGEVYHYIWYGIVWYAYIWSNI